MKLSSAAIFLALIGIGAPAFADDATSTTPVESYSYGMKLDIQKVISISDTADKCGPVPTQMTYEDSKGQRHILQYSVMGTGCSNG
ncbi:MULTISPECIES: DUF2790 domain-containing protein [Pseudomonas]|uniref:DUF2790 domain-containing protein n=1 Tax=Pseudomonas TaxID=286 RepID=UPI0006B68276|nr:MULTISPECIES: DUF2790 domain-containing protein [Pseudomonas]KOY01692.1 hypothetical protein AM274_13975 [Pseudomonas nunensis]UZE14218.1 DUF2790 domain-containing protein [Pseudomonas sp. B21-053]